MDSWSPEWTSGKAAYGSLNVHDRADDLGADDDVTHPSLVPQKKQWYAQLYTNKDWWSVWQGLTCMALIILVATIFEYQGAPPGPRRWDGQILNAWSGNRFDTFAVLAVIVVLIATFAYFIIEVSKPLSKRKKYKASHTYAGETQDISVFVRDFCVSLTFISILGLSAWWLSEQKSVHKYGFTFEVWGLVFGMVFANLYGWKWSGQMPDWMEGAAIGEEYIKVGLVLLGLDIRTIGDLAIPGLITSWLVTPVVVIVAFKLVGDKLLGYDDSNGNSNGTFTRSLGIMLACGLAVCGSSAATAVHSAIPQTSAPHRDEELKLTIALLNVFTIVQMIAWPYFAWGVGMEIPVAAAWFGGSIDGTGNVVAAGAILDELYNPSDNVTLDNQLVFKGVEIASTVKMIQNSIIGPVAISVAIYWMTYMEKDSKRNTSCTSRLLEVWQRFPKFVLGFLIDSFILTLIKAYANENVAKSTESLLIATRSWWFTVGFVAVGLTTNIPSMLRRLKGGKAIMFYVVGQFFDLLLTFLFAHLSFGVLYRDTFYK